MHLKTPGGYYSKRPQNYAPENNPLPILRLLTVTFSSCEKPKASTASPEELYSFMALKHKGLLCSSSWDSHRQLSPGQHQHPAPRLHFKHTLPEQCAADNSGTSKKNE